MSRSRYVIGIDLGTTNSALAYVDSLSDRPRSEILPVPQLDSPGSVREAAQLPSSLYIPTGAESDDPALSVPSIGMPLGFGIAGAFARSQSMLLPGRVVASAKSWLCHSGVERTEKILPWGSEELTAERKVSPVTASACYLAHLRAAWDAGPGAFHPDYRFDRQEVIITVPASFDEAAQQLTLDAARSAGFPEGVRLIEEPQAAFYCFLEAHEEGRALSRVMPRESGLVLICDVGGGTTDLSLFSMSIGKGSAPVIERIAVSDHLLLGGDNIDLAIARLAESRIVGEGERLTGRQWGHLVFQARALKETVLSQGELPAESFSISVPGSGSSLFAATLSASVTAEELSSLVLDGFLPVCDGEDRPIRSRAGLKEWGLPYAEDGAITRHLAGFVAGRRIDAVLFNGGSLKPAFLRERLRSLMERWQAGASLVELENPDFDLAVARGAAHYGLALRGEATKIRAGYPRSIYLELQRRKGEDEPKLVCVLAQGAEPGSSFELKEQRFVLLVDQPVRFQPFFSIYRPADKPGDVLDYDPDVLHPLPSMQTALSSGEVGPRKKGGGELPVELETDLNELGLLKIYCVSVDPERPGRHELRFNLRRDEEEERAAPIDPGVPPDRLKKAEERLNEVFGKAAKPSDETAGPRNLPRDLEGLLGLDRDKWELPLLRGLWPRIAQGVTRRGRSPAHETAWLSLAGYVLRPGYGADLDPWRITELWRCFELGLAFPKESRSLVQWHVMWRRVAGGLDAEKQAKIWGKLLPHLRSKAPLPEAFRLAGSLERLPAERKIELADIVLSKARKSRAPLEEHSLWTLGRVGSRVALYGGAHAVLSPKVIAGWLETLFSANWRKADHPALCSMLSQAARVSGDRELDLPYQLRMEVASRMKSMGASAHQLEVVREHVPMEEADKAKLFGEALPAGLKLVE